MSRLTPDQLNYLREKASEVECEIKFPLTQAPSNFERDPETGCYFDPENGFIFDPESGYIFDPEDIQIFDPENIQIFDPENIQIFDSASVFDHEDGIGVLNISDGIYDSYGNRINVMSNLCKLLKLIYFTFKYQDGDLELSDDCRSS